MINQGKAAQGTPGLKFKEVNDWAKEFSSNRDQYVKMDTPPSSSESTLESIKSMLTNSSLNTNKKDRTPLNKSGGKTDYNMEFMKKNLQGKKVNGKEVCLLFNTKDGCRHGTNCKHAHVCGYIPRGEKEPCGKGHKKSEHRRS